MENTDIIPLSSMDIPLPSSSLVQEELAEIDLVLADCKQKKDLRPALDYGRSLIMEGHSKAVAVLYLLNHLNKCWKDFEPDEDLAETVYQEWGLSRATINNCLGIWRDLFDNPNIPAKVKPELLERPMRTLKRLRRPAREELFDDNDWEEVADSPSHYDAMKVVDSKVISKRGYEPLVIKVYSDGRLVAYYKGQLSHLGILRNSTEDMSDDIRYKAITRIIKAAGIQEG